MEDLTVIRIESLKPVATRQEIPDAKVRGLRIIVQSSGKKSWAVRYRLAGRPAKFTIGAYPAIGLAEARATALEALALVAKGIVPAGIRGGKPAQGELVTEVVESFIARYVTVKTKQGRPPKAGSVKETSRILRREILPA